MKILYLFNNYRADRLDKVKKQGFNDNHFYGLFRLPHYGLRADYAEIEQYFPLKICQFLRRKINIYFINLLLFWKFFSYDIVFHVSSFAPQFLCIALFLKRPKWVIYDYSLTGLLGDGKKFKQKILRFIISRTSGIITLSEKEAEMLKIRFTRLKDKIAFIRYGTDLEYFKPLNIKEVHQILTVGLDFGRDYQTLFEATEGLGVRVVATQSNRKGLRGKLPEYVSVASFSDSELLEEYAKSKIIVIPLNTKDGVNDAMGCSTLVEAMSMGKAIIATRTFTMESYISNGINGLLVKEGDVEELRLAIRRLLSDEKLRKELGIKAREFAERYCGAEKVARDMADFFKYISNDKT